MLQLAAVLNNKVSQRHPVAELSMSHQPSLVFISLSVEWGFRAKWKRRLDGRKLRVGTDKMSLGWTKDARGRELVSVDGGLGSFRISNGNI